jgi:hypothetical protein
MLTLHPQKQTVVISVVCLAAVAITAIYVYGQTPSKQGTDSQLVSVSTKTDIGHAGMAAIGTSTDWKKQFFGNGSPDGSFTPAQGSPSTGSEENVTATDQLSRDVFTQLVNLKQTGLLNNSEMVSTTVSDLLAKASSASDSPRTYTINDILVSPNDSVTALKTYGNNVGSLLQTYTPKQDSAKIALDGMQGKDASYSEELQANATVYRTILNGLLAITAPQSMSAYHLGLVNAASDMIYISTAFSAAGTDPMGAINGLGMYQTAYTLGLKNLITIRNTLHAAGIVYGSSEGGSFFFTH